MRAVRQPQGTARIDWTNPLTRKLEQLIIGACTHDLVRQRAFSQMTTDVRRAGGSQGPTWRGMSGSNNQRILVNSPEAVSGAITIACLASRDQTPTGSGDDAIASIATSRQATGGTGGWELNLGNALGAGADLAKPRAGGGTATGLWVNGVLQSGVNPANIVLNNNQFYVVVATWTSAPAASPATANVRWLINGNTNGLFGRVALGALWRRSLAPAEIRSFSKNPWQLVWVPDSALDGAATVTIQTLRPVSDVSSGTWTPSTGVDLYAMVDEAVADDADYDTTSASSSMTLALGVGTDPNSSSGHIVRYRIKGTGILTVTLMQGATIIATWTHSPAPSSFTTYEQTLAGAEADAITDYADLRLKFTAS